MGSFPKYDWPAIFAARGGKSRAEIAHEMGCTRQAVGAAATRHGVVFSDMRGERMRALNADPEFNPLLLLTPEQRADYDTLKKIGYSREEAFAAIGFDPEAAS